MAGNQSRGYQVSLDYNNWIFMGKTHVGFRTGRTSLFRTVNSDVAVCLCTSSCVLMALTVAIYLVTVCFCANYSQVFSDEGSFFKAKLILEGVQDRKPTDKDFFRIVEEFGGKLTIDEQRRLFARLLTMQISPVESKDIFALYQAKRNSLRSGQLSYEETVNFLSGQRSGQKRRILYEFAFSELGDMYLKRTGKIFETSPEQDIITLSDNVYTRVTFSDAGSIHGSLTPHTEHQRNFYQSNMPLILANLFDEERFLQPHILGRDIIELLSIEGRAFVLEEKEHVNGKNCIVLFTSSERFYLVPEYDYAMTRFESYLPVLLDEDRDKNISDQRKIGRKCIYESDLTDFIDCGNGIWVPKTIESVSYDNGKRRSEISVKVKDVQLNKPLQKSFFTDVIPDDAMVSDGINNLIYRKSDSPTINGLLKETVKSKRVWTFQIISVTLGIIMIIIALIMMYLKRRNAA
jgi:hypothetical protein